MKLVRFLKEGIPAPGVLVGDQILDVRAMAFDLNDYDHHFFTHWGLERLANLLNDALPKWVDADAVTLCSPVAVNQIICVGENYADHARERGNEPPALPIFFSKSLNALAGPNDRVVLPSESRCIDMEIELAVVLKRDLKDATREQAGAAIAGYTIANDLSARDVQAEGPQWFRGKSFDGFCPVGPFLLTTDEVGEAPFELTSRQNGEVIQCGDSSDMILSIPDLLVQLSRGHTLSAGSLILTGTPAGIGSAQTPPKPLCVGDEIELTITALGKQRNEICASSQEG